MTALQRLRCGHFTGDLREYFFREVLNLDGCFN